MATNPKPKRVGPFPAGMDNRAPDYALELPQGAGHLLRDAFNVNVTSQGSVKTRVGYSLARAGVNVHSIWAPIGGAYGLFCEGGTIYRFEVDRLGAITTVTPVSTGFGITSRVRHAEVNEAVFFTDGLRKGSYHPRPGPTPQWAAAVGGTVKDRILAPMPAGSCIAYAFGRLMVGVDSLLIYSEPHDCTHYSVSAGYELFPDPVRCIVGLDGAVIVATTQAHYLISGGFPAARPTEILRYGAPAQDPGYRQDGGAHWMSNEGVISCNKLGELVNLQEEHLAMQVTGDAATLWRRHDGMETIVAAMSEPSTSGAGVGSYITAKLVKKEKT